MDKATRKERKEQIVKDWEKNFGLKLEDELSEEGLKRFWSDDTWCHEALGILMGATVNHALNEIIDDLDSEVVGVIVKKEVPDEELCNCKAFKIVRKADNVMLDKEFETEQAANDYIIEQVKHSPCTVDDFIVVKVIM